MSHIRQERTFHFAGILGSLSLHLQFLLGKYEFGNVTSHTEIAQAFAIFVESGDTTDGQPARLLFIMREFEMMYHVEWLAHCDRVFDGCCRIILVIGQHALEIVL